MLDENVLRRKLSPGEIVSLLEVVARSPVSSHMIYQPECFNMLYILVKAFHKSTKNSKYASLICTNMKHYLVKASCMAQASYT